jgi:hypothetical protein
VGTGSNGTWQRSQDAAETGELLAGTIVMVTEGTVYADTQWKLVTNDPIVIGTTGLVWEQNSAFAFGNIFANGTAVLANTVGDTVSFQDGNNISITGNAATKSVIIAVSENPNFTGNVTGNFFLGNGSQLTGIQTTTFSSTAPVSPSQGDIWIAATTGIQYIYFDDGDSSQWAEMQADVSFSSGGSNVSSPGGQPSNVYFLQGTTSNNTETELFVNGEPGNRIAVPVDSSMYYTIDVTCRRTNGSDFAAFTLKSVVSNAGNTVSDVGSVYEIVVARTDASISVDSRADDANNSIGVYVTGVTGKSFAWKAQVTVVEV